MNRHERALQAIRSVHTDLSVSSHKTLLNLQNLQDEIEVLIDAIREDIAREESLRTETEKDYG
jgi:hypothetical protein